MKKITFEPQSINDLELKVPEPKIDLHVRLPIPVHKQLTIASREKGIDKSNLVTLAIKAFLK